MGKRYINPRGGYKRKAGTTGRLIVEHVIILIRANSPFVVYQIFLFDERDGWH